MSYLLDTDWVISALVGRQPAADVLKNLASSRVSVTWLSVAEVYEGAFRSPNPEAHLVTFRHFLSAYSMLYPSDPILERFAEMRAMLRRHGALIPNFDLMIAATALHHDLTLLTFNQRHFQRIAGLRLYQPS